MYYIIIGERQRRKSHIRRCFYGCTLIAVTHKVPIVNSDTWRSFWVSVEDGVISVGQVGADAFMEWTDEEPLEVNYVGFSSGGSGDGQWRFCDQGEFEARIAPGQRPQSP